MPRKKVVGKHFTLAFELGEQSGWVVSVQEVPGCHTQGRSISHARKRIREALSLWIGDRAASAAKFMEQFPFPKTILNTIKRIEDLKNQLEELQGIEDTATTLRKRMVQQLVEDQGLSYRDTADLLGISHSRVDQLFKASRKEKRRPKPRLVAKSRR